MKNKIKEICPICKGVGKINKPSKQQKDIPAKRKRAKALLKMGYSYREIMHLMGYKGVRSIARLLGK